MKSSIDILVERSALLIALSRHQDGLKINKLESIIKDWKNHIKFLINKNFKFSIDKDSVKLNSKITYDFYQSIPPEIMNDVEKILWKLIDKPKLQDPDTDLQKIILPNPKLKSLSCINCADPPCMMYKLDEFGSVDKYPQQICPADLIKIDSKGFVNIDQDHCTGCMLCIIRCPVNAISLENKLATKKNFPESEKGTTFKIKEVTITEKKKLTEKILSKFGKPDLKFNSGEIKEILDNFDKKISNLEENWDRDKYYVFIRNVFRELGLEVHYTGSGGKLRRADISIIKPFVCGIEVKSPAEGDISVGAIRQAFDARSEAKTTYKADDTKLFCAAIAQGINRGSHKKAIEYYEQFNVKIPLIVGRQLLYILLKHVTELPQDPTFDLQRLFSDYYGEITKKELKDYFRKYFDLRILDLKNEKNVLPLLLSLSGKTNDEKIKQIENLKNLTEKEIDWCFNEPTRISRGSYSKIS